MTLHELHTRCGICGGATQYDLDTDRSGRLRPFPAADTIRCASCQLFTCGGCVADSDRTMCRACAACNVCGRDAGRMAIDVTSGTILEHNLADAGERLERLCPACHQARVIRWLA